jgi:hypothetical protein
MKFAPLAMIAAGMLGGILLLTGTPDRSSPSDDVTAVFDQQEEAFRRLSRERSEALRDGTIKSESESVKWMQSRYLPAAEGAWTSLLTAEKEAFGGEQWTAEKEARYIERYAR